MTPGIPGSLLLSVLAAALLSCSSDGETCLTDTPCEDDLACTRLALCNTRVGQCQAIACARSGQACSTHDHCAGGLNCDPSQGTCVAPAASSCITGAPCTSDLQCTREELCNLNFAEPRCQLIGCGGPGVPCGSDRHCEDGLTCNSGIAACTGAAELGEDCGEFIPCAEGTCNPSYIPPRCTRGLQGDLCEEDDSLCAPGFACDRSQDPPTCTSRAHELLDVLLVVDNSASMCSEQVEFAATVQAMLSDLHGDPGLNVRVAATTMDMQCDPALPTIGSARGTLNTRPASGFPPGCQVERTRACTTDADCVGLDCQEFGACEGGGDWSCRKAQSAMCVTNPNGSVNTSCRRRCATDQECRQLLGDDRYVCQKPSGSESDWGCMLPPQTSTCREYLPPVLDSDSLDQVPCLATVGANQNKCYKYEQGLEAAATALEMRSAMTCPGNDDCLEFPRSESMLLVVFLTDEDDCSSVAPEAIGEDDHETCAFLATTDDGGPLVPVSQYVARLEALAELPQRVMVAVIAGDAMGPSEEVEEQEREAYVDSKSDPFVCYQQTAICEGPHGRADWGSRYAQLAEAFGHRGYFANICDSAGMSAAMEDIGELVRTRAEALRLDR